MVASLFLGRLPRGGVDRNCLVQPATVAAVTSPPSRGRGSKRARPKYPAEKGGRLPRGGVDRNRLRSTRATSNSASPPSRGRGSKHQRRGAIIGARRVASLAGAWIETRPFCSGFPRALCRLPRGGVDRNFSNSGISAVDSSVASLAGAWIETPSSNRAARKACVASLAGAWIETATMDLAMPRTSVASLAGAWIETSCS